MTSNDLSNFEDLPNDAEYRAGYKKAIQDVLKKIEDNKDEIDMFEYGTRKIIDPYLEEEVKKLDVYGDKK